MIHTEEKKEKAPQTPKFSKSALRKYTGSRFSKFGGGDGAPNLVIMYVMVTHLFGAPVHQALGFL